MKYYRNAAVTRASHETDRTVGIAADGSAWIDAQLMCLLVVIAGLVSAIF